MISPATIDEVRKIPIEDVVRVYVPELKKSGQNAFTAKSPFTDEKSASFFVVPKKNIFKCFSSGKGGSGITFVMEKTGCTYVDAIKTLCSDHKIRIEYDQTQPKEYYDRIEALHKVNRAALRQYVEQLRGTTVPGVMVTDITDDRPCMLEINKRGWTIDTITQWQLGFAPGEVGEDYTPQKWNFLSKQIINSNFYKEGIELGLIKSNEQSGITYDTFRNRIIFPIHDHDGKLVAFGGRALKVDKYNQKYINSNDSDIFRKGNVLYGLHFAIDAIKREKFAVLLEGYADVISFHQAGIENSVSTSGTALTDEQCKLLKRFTNKVVIIRDGDEAGVRATLRDVDILLKHSFQISTVPLPSVISWQREVKKKKVKAVKPKGKKLTTKKKPAAAAEPEFETVREVVFITDRTDEKVTYTYITDKGERLTADRSMKETTIDKVDPDDLVRMYNPQQQ